MTIELQFLGAAGTVTGSRFMLRQNGRHILIDCGLFQDGRRLKELNWQPCPVPPQQTFIVHGESKARQALQADLKQWGWHTKLPTREAVFSIK
ncbi:MAG: hypothetical protein KC441_10265 [Anaerolineales bacterium]|nr:hypothetical protein [Anaerolineales bacterium]